MKCKVLFPHSRYIDGQLVMYEPMLSGIVAVPDDDQTLAAIEAKWLEPTGLAGKKSDNPTQAELAEALLISPDTPRDVATEMVVRMIEELEVVLDKVPKTANGVVIMPDQDVWFHTDDGLVSGVVLSITWGDDFWECLVRDCYGKQHMLDSDDCYSTREAAEAARKETES